MRLNIRINGVPRFYAILWVLLLQPLQAQNYSITSHTIDSGGGTSSGGSYSVTGAIGHHHGSSTSTGGTFAVTGGFFGQFMALQQTGAPRVSIRGIGANVQVVWSAEVPGWVLQWNGQDLVPENWTDVPGVPTVSGAEQYHQFAASGRLFFRLRKL